jgi:hypothetical protein
MFSGVVWMAVLAGTAFWLGSGSNGWDFNGDGFVTLRDVWGVAGIVAIMPMLGVVLAIASLVPEPILRFLEFEAVADWLLKGSLSGVVGVASWLVLLMLLFLAEFKIIGWIKPGAESWKHALERPASPSPGKHQVTGLDGTTYCSTQKHQ